MKAEHHFKGIKMNPFPLSNLYYHIHYSYIHVQLYHTHYLFRSKAGVKEYNLPEDLQNLLYKKYLIDFLLFDYKM